MEKAIKQRLLGGLVLVAGAALFLPMLLDGSGAPLTVPPMPPAPKVPVADAVAPRLDAEVKQADAAVDAAHEAPADARAVEPAAAEGDVAPDAAAGSPEPAVALKPAAARPVVDDSKRLAAEKAARDAAAQSKAAQDKAAQDKALQEKAAQQKAAQDKAGQEKAIQDKAKADAEKARLAAEAAKKEATAKAAKAEAKPAADSKPATLPEAWVVQVASLSARDKADALVQKLRQKNYRAVLHQQGNVWKVVIGPELRKEVAESIKSRLAADPDLKLSGWVQAYKP